MSNVWPISQQTRHACVYLHPSKEPGNRDTLLLKKDLVPWIHYPWKGLGTKDKLPCHLWKDYLLLRSIINNLTTIIILTTSFYLEQTTRLSGVFNISNGHLCKSEPFDTANFSLKSDTKRSEFLGNAGVTLHIPKMDDQCRDVNIMIPAHKTQVSKIWFYHSSGFSKPEIGLVNIIRHEFHNFPIWLLSLYKTRTRWDIGDHTLKEITIHFLFTFFRKSLSNQLQMGPPKHQVCFKPFI